MSKTEQLMQKINAKVDELQAEKKPLYAIDEPVRAYMKPRMMRAFVTAVYPGELGKFYYDLTLMEPMFAGSGVCHKVKGFAESKMGK